MFHASRRKPGLSCHPARMAAAVAAGGRTRPAGGKSVPSLMPAEAAVALLLRRYSRFFAKIR